MPHGSIYTEGTWGSGGGRAGSTLGGRGGGRLHLKINTQLTLEGTMKTNGDDATVGVIRMTEFKRNAWQDNKNILNSVLLTSFFFRQP